MELLNASILKAAVSTRSATTKESEISAVAAVDLPRTKVLVKGSCLIKHEGLYDE
jgi:hypothetical protein